MISCLLLLWRRRRRRRVRSSIEIAKGATCVMLLLQCWMVRWSVLRMQAEWVPSSRVWYSWRRRSGVIGKISRVLRVEVRIESSNANDGRAIVHARTYGKTSELSRCTEIRPQTHGSQLFQAAFLGTFVLKPDLYNIRSR